MKTISLTDKRSGKSFELSYEPESGAYQINGYDVVRKSELEDAEDEFIFGAPTAGPTELFFVSRAQLERLREAPDIPNDD